MNNLATILIGVNLTIAIMGYVSIKRKLEKIKQDNNYLNKNINSLEDNLNNHDKDIRLVLGQYAWDLKDIKDTSIENKKAIVDELTITKDEIKSKMETETTRAIVTPYRYMAK